MATAPPLVLVGEDSTANHVALNALLERCGVAADFVTNGFAVVERASGGRYRAILLDLILPGLTGFEAAKELRRIEYGTGRHTPIVAVTALDPELCRDACIDAGMDDFIGKPFDLETLRRHLGRWISLGEGGAPAAVIDSFLGASRVLAERLRAAGSARDCPTGGELARAPKGSELLASARELKRLAGELEEGVRCESWSRTLATYRELTEAHRRLTADLKAPLDALL